MTASTCGSTPRVARVVRDPGGGAARDRGGPSTPPRVAPATPVGRPPGANRGPRRHAGGVLVAAAESAPPASGDLPGAAAVVPGLLRVRAQRPEARQGPAGVVDR